MLCAVLRVLCSAALSEDTTSMLNEMSTSALNAAESDPQDMLCVLGSLEERLDNMEAIAQRYVAYQSLLQEAGDDFGSLQHVRREFERRKAAWTSLNEWIGKSFDWLNRCILGIDLETLTRAHTGTGIIKASLSLSLPLPPSVPIMYTVP